MTAYQEEFQRSLADPSSYWLERASDVHRYKTPHQGVDASRSPYNTWFVTAFKLVAIVDKLPKTRSGKILRGALRSIADSTDWNMPATIENPSVLDDITQSLRSLGLAKENT